jgi:hypothetical protein
LRRRHRGLGRERLILARALRGRRQALAGREDHLRNGARIIENARIIEKTWPADD